MSKDIIFFHFSVMSFILLLFLITAFAGWAGAGVDKTTFIEFLQNGISKMIIDFKHVCSRIY